MKQETYTVNSLPACKAFAGYVQALLAEHKYLTFTWRIGEKPEH